MERKIYLSRAALERAKQIIRVKGTLSASDVHAILTADGVDCPPVDVLEKNMEAWRRTGIYERLREETRRAMRPDEN
jgi:hypothetical protein